MNPIQHYIFAIILAGMVSGCHSTNSETSQPMTSQPISIEPDRTEWDNPGPPPAKVRESWPLEGVGRYPVECRVESSTVFIHQGVRCRLLGVSPSNDPKIRKQALAFVKGWLKDGSDARILDFYNGSKPLVEPDETCVVWACRWQGRLRCLNIDLVAAGLAEVDYTGYEAYEFTTPIKGSAPNAAARWRQALDSAYKQRGKGVDSSTIDW